MSYVDGFILPVPRDKLDEYRRMAGTAGAIWREHGALTYVECIADDVKTVVFAWITYASRADRDRINEAVMADPRMAPMMDPANFPFDGKRMIWGGFETLVSL